MIAVDIPAALLTLGLVALGACTASSTRSLSRPGLGRRRAEQPVPPSIPARRVVTGRPAALPAGPLPPQVDTAPARQSAPRQDGPLQDRTAAPYAELDSTIDRLLEHHPERLATMMTAWINEDETPTRNRRRSARR